MEHQLIVDTRFRADAEAVLRYAPSLPPGSLDLEIAGEVSQREGFRIVQLARYRGVDLFAMDETTGMKTGTCKSLDGCISATLCRQAGHKRIAFSSGGNAGVALTEYCGRAGIETFFFCPSTTLYKLNGNMFQRPGAHLIAVEGSDARVKEAARLCSEILAIPLVPRLEWRLLASGIRGLFLAEALQQRGQGFHWLSQSICAGYGPIGIYHTLLDLTEGTDIQREWVPRFLGVQQAGMAPVAAAWAAGQTVLPQDGPRGWSEESIEPSLYSEKPDRTYPLLHQVMSLAGGDMITVRHAEFDFFGGLYARMLKDSGIPLTTIHMYGEPRYLERAGLLAGAGVLKAIQEGRIHEGESVLCSLTGGAGPKPERPARAHRTLEAGCDLESEIRKLAT
jgi:threonine synthase